MSGTDLQQLAFDTAVALKERIGVDGAIVIVMRKGDDSMGCAAAAPEIPIDTAIAAGVTGLTLIRQASLQALKEKAETEEP